MAGPRSLPGGDPVLKNLYPVKEKLFYTFSASDFEFEFEFDLLES